MRVLIVHAHPEPKSFNGALTAAAREALTAAGHEVVVSDLYAMGFDPVSDRRNFTTVKDGDYFKQQAEELHATDNAGFAPDVEAELSKLEACDLLIFQFPLWWFGLPAILKGWCDRVLAMGRIYGRGRWYDRGVFAGKRAIISVTLGGGPTMYQPDGLNGDLTQILFPINHGIFWFTGFTPLEPFVLHGPARMSPEERSATLDRWRQALGSIETRPTLAYLPLDSYDEHFRLKQPSE